MKKIMEKMKKRMEKMKKKIDGKKIIKKLMVKK